MGKRSRQRATPTPTPEPLRQPSAADEPQQPELVLLVRRRQRLKPDIASEVVRLRAGNVARGEDGPDSDVDLLIDVPEHTGLFTLLALEGTLERLLKVDVDLAAVGDLKAQVREAALREAIPL